MQMRGILLGGVIKTSAMCAVGGGVLRKQGTKLFIAFHKCHYRQIRRSSAAGLAERRLADRDRRCWSPLHGSAEGVHGF